jgi:hypothetical protein
LEKQTLETIEVVSDFFIVCIGIDAFVAHVRAPMGDALFWAFLPDSARVFDKSEEAAARRRFSNSTRQRVLDSPLSQISLVPALMKLFGDVQVGSFHIPGKKF